MYCFSRKCIYLANHHALGVEVHTLLAYHASTHLATSSTPGSFINSTAELTTGQRTIATPENHFSAITSWRNTADVHCLMWCLAVNQARIVSKPIALNLSKHSPLFPSISCDVSKQSNLRNVVGRSALVSAHFYTERYTLTTTKHYATQ